MLKTFSQSGLSFQYPSNWQLEEEKNETGWTISLYSPETAFMTIHFDRSLPTPEAMVDSTLAILKEEHKTLESEERIGEFAEQMSFGLDIQFFSFDLPCSCWVRSFFGNEGTFLVLWQLSDAELETRGVVLDAICESMKAVAED